MSQTQDEPKPFQRLSDRILFALELAIEQEDVAISETLRKALDMALTRKAGGKEFVEKRDYPEEMESVMGILNDMTTKSKYDYATDDD